MIQKNDKMAYQYDVFLSYNRKFPHGEWVNDIFYPLFVSYLEDALNQDVRVFKDDTEIKSGEAWKLRIEKSLVYSKVLVAIFSPAYFRSEWCSKEFAVMNYRQKNLGYLSYEKPNGLVIPLKIFDGEHFPEYANNLQMLDLIEYNRVGGGVKQTELYINLQGKLQEWVYEVAAAINAAPQWDESWNTSDWIEKTFEGLGVVVEPENIKPPTL